VDSVPADSHRRCESRSATASAQVELVPS
jgi:hypothetical protein